MSYSAIGSYQYGSGPCIALYANYDGTQIPGWVCPVPMQETGHKPPRPRFCEGGPHQFQQALKLGGHYPGAVDGVVGPGTVNAIKSVVAKHNLPWDGDPWSVGPSICQAVIQDALQNATCSDPSKMTVGCVVKGNGPLNKYANLQPPGASTPAPATTTTTTATTSPISSSTYRAAINPKLANMLASRIATTRLASSSTPTLGERLAASAKSVPSSPAPSTSSPGPMTYQPGPSQDPDAGSVVPQTPPELQPQGEGIPTWAYVAGGVAVLGGIGAIVMLRKK